MVSNSKELDKIIIGRVEPHIYAFITNTIPNFLKIGDTYRLVSDRLDEWKTYFPDLKQKFEEPAKVDNDIYFRDYAIHYFLENILKKKRLTKSDIPKGTYFSKEFFKDTNVKDVEKAIKDINQDYNNKSNRYNFYNAFTSLPQNIRYASTGVWAVRDNQKKVIDAFCKAKSTGRTNLLMYAVMRFGKSFTSMCCAEKIKAKLVVIVSAKADVKEEWKKTIESAENFKEYEFLTSTDLKRNYSIIKKVLDNNKKVALFLTLQDLQGKEIKNKHKQIFKQIIDLLIIDETHFGARAEKFGEVLKDNHKKDNEDHVDTKKAEEQITKILNAHIKLHLSGTPYRILMGSEFKKDDIIAFIQYSDIVKEQEKWNKENLLKDDVEEWENPYYGFPQMIRFAFNPNESSMKKLEELKKNGITYAFSELFKPKSIKKVNDNRHKFFIHEKEILELFEVIDGSKDDNNLLGFLDYKKIKEGNMCRHIVCVLPYCASCDALENLIKKHKNKFKNLKDYEIINISGIDNQNLYNDIGTIKEKIRKCENNNKKTITLTVNRMLTGSTVEQWDTMLYFKDTSSPQEYDQAIFRLQNQYIKTYKTEKGDIIKYNMKPQTILVDFSPNRMFRMQELKSQIYNVNVDDAGNKKLEERIEEELSISPIITINKDKIKQVKANDIMVAVSNYSKNRGIVEETNEIPVDLSLTQIPEIWNRISNENELGSKLGFEIKVNDGEGENIEAPDLSTEPSANKQQPKLENQNDKNKDLNIEKQFRMYYVRMLYFAFLTKDKVESIDDILDIISDTNNERIFNNLQLNKNVIVAIKKYMDKFKLSKLDYAIQNINHLSHEDSLSSIERAKIANKKFGKLGESEVVTPENITGDMINLLPNKFFKDCVENNKAILDIASKEGEFAIAIYKKFISLGYNVNQIKDLIYSIPTSTITYEFTRKIYEILGLNVDNIAYKFNSYDLLEVKKDNKIDYDKIKLILTQNKKFSEITMNDNPKKGDDYNMKFDAIVGNPPYQLSGGSGGNNDAPIYQYFVNISNSFFVQFSSLIIPARWFSAGRENLLKEFRINMLNNKKIKELVVFTKSRDVFLNVEIKGGLCYFLIEQNINKFCNYSLIQDNNIKTTRRKLNDFDVLIREPQISNIVKKVMNNNVKDTVYSVISNDTPFGISSNPKTSKKNPMVVYEKESPKHNTKLYHIEKQKRKVEYIERKLIKKNIQDIDKYKVFITESGGAGNDKVILGKPEYAPRNSVCSQSYLYSAFNTEIEAKNFIKYIKTKFLRILVSSIKISQSAPNRVYRFVPLQNFTEKSDINWNKSIEEIDKQLYKKYKLSEEEIKFIESMIKPME